MAWGEILSYIIIITHNIYLYCSQQIYKKQRNSNGLLCGGGDMTHFEIFTKIFYLCKDKRGNMCLHLNPNVDAFLEDKRNKKPDDFGFSEDSNEMTAPKKGNDKRNKK